MWCQGSVKSEQGVRQVLPASEVTGWQKKKVRQKSRSRSKDAEVYKGCLERQPLLVQEAFPPWLWFRYQPTTRCSGKTVAVLGHGWWFICNKIPYHSRTFIVNLGLHFILVNVIFLSISWRIEFLIYVISNLNAGYISRVFLCWSLLWLLHHPSTTGLSSFYLSCLTFYLHAAIFHMALFNYWNHSVWVHSTLCCIEPGFTAKNPIRY